VQTPAVTPGGLGSAPSTLVQLPDRAEQAIALQQGGVRDVVFDGAVDTRLEVKILAITMLVVRSVHLA